MDNNISVSIHIEKKNNGEYDIEAVLTEFGWEGQIDTEIVIFDNSWSLPSFSDNPDNVCEDYRCYGPDTRPHKHLTMSTAVIRAESRE